MGELIRRRGLILPSGGTPSEWDYEWDYTQGLPSSPWVSSSSGTYSTPTLETNGVRIQTGSGGSFNYTLPASTTQLGVVEAEVWIPSQSKGTKNRAQVRFGDATYCAYIVFFKSGKPSNAIKPWNVSSVGNATTMAYYTDDTPQTLRIELNGSTANIYLDGSLIKQNLSTSTMQNKGGLLVGQYNGENIPFYLRSIKVKFGRL